MFTGDIVGFEALLRWRDRHGRIFSPDTISAAFEELELAEAMGAAMLDRVLCDMVSWRDMGLSFGHVAINAAPAEFRRHILADRIIEKLEKARSEEHTSELQSLMRISYAVFCLKKKKKQKTKTLKYM